VENLSNIIICTEKKFWFCSESARCFVQECILWTLLWRWYSICKWFAKWECFFPFDSFIQKWNVRTNFYSLIVY